MSHVADGLGHFELLESEDLFGDDSEHGAKTPMLSKIVGAKPTDTLEAIGEIQIVGLIELLPDLR